MRDFAEHVGAEYTPISCSRIPNLALASYTSSTILPFKPRLFKKSAAQGQDDCEVARPGGLSTAAQGMADVPVGPLLLMVEVLHHLIYQNVLVFAVYSVYQVVQDFYHPK